MDGTIVTAKSSPAMAAPAPKPMLAAGSSAPATTAPAPAVKAPPAAASKPALKAASQRAGFKVNEFVVYPAHGVGQITAIEEQEVAGYKLELFVITFSKDKMTLKVPTPKVASVGMRKLAEQAQLDPEFSEKFLRFIIEEVIRHHEQAQDAG